MTDITAGTGGRRALRAAAGGGLLFTVLYVIHRILQWPGPDNSSPAAVVAYEVDHRGALLGSEVALGLGLLAFIVFLAPLGSLLWQAREQTLSLAVLLSGALFLAMGFVSTAAEAALVGVADGDQPAAVLALDEFQGRVPVVFAIAALATTISLAILRTRLVWPWLGPVGLVAAALFLIGSVLSLLGSTPEQNSSLIGIGVFVVWMLLLIAGLWRASTEGATASGPAGDDREPDDREPDDREPDDRPQVPTAYQEMSGARRTRTNSAGWPQPRRPQG